MKIETNIYSKFCNDYKKRLKRKNKNIDKVYVNDEGVVICEYKYVPPTYKRKQKVGLYTSKSRIKQHF
jgi:hypothetical protein